MREYIVTDLAFEFLKNTSDFKENKKWEEFYVGKNIRMLRGELNNETEETRCGRSTGTYLTWLTSSIWQLEDEDFFSLERSIGGELRGMVRKKLNGKEKKNGGCVLVVGLGNGEITADAVGPETVKRITVTRHLFHTPMVSKAQKNRISVAAITPGVVGNTGIETLEIIRGTVQRISPDLVLVVDALAAKSCERLAATVQLSDCGLFPGSGIGNARMAIAEKTLGIPVLALGVPTVVNSTTMLLELMEAGGIEELPHGMERILERGKGFFVTPKEADLILKSVAMLLSSAIDYAFGAEL